MNIIEGRKKWIRKYQGRMGVNSTDYRIHYGSGGNSKSGLEIIRDTSLGPGKKVD